MLVYTQWAMSANLELYYAKITIGSLGFKYRKKVITKITCCRDYLSIRDA